jgi:hypothetical protein
MYNVILLYSLLIYVQDIIAQDPETHGSTFVPIILGSDKTTVSVVTGQNDYYPLYLSIGNVHNNVCRAHRNAIVLVGFFAIAKSKSDIACTMLILEPYNIFFSNKKIRQ